MKRQVFLVWFLIFLAWSVFRANFMLAEWADELLVKPLIFVLPVFYIVLIREKKSPAVLGLAPTSRDFFSDLAIGAVIGVLFALEGLLANFIKYGQFSFAPIMASKVTGGITVFLGLNLATSLWEEILGRGYMFKRLLDRTGNQFWSAVVSSFLFLLLHIPILLTRLQLRGISLLVYPVSIMILGITNCYIFSARRSLTLPILIHAFWNMTVALYL